jgi:hypothetical protein
MIQIQMWYKKITPQTRLTCEQTQRQCNMQLNKVIETHNKSNKPDQAIRQLIVGCSQGGTARQKEACSLGAHCKGGRQPTHEVQRFNHRRVSCSSDVKGGCGRIEKGGERCGRAALAVDDMRYRCSANQMQSNQNNKDTSRQQIDTSTLDLCDAEMGTNRLNQEGGRCRNNGRCCGYG